MSTKGSVLEEKPLPLPQGYVPGKPMALPAPREEPAKPRQVYQAIGPRTMRTRKPFLFANMGEDSKKPELGPRPWAWKW